MSIIAVSHILDDGAPYIKYLDRVFSLECIIPKPNSIDKRFLAIYPQSKILSWTRDRISKNGKEFIDIINKKINKENKIIFLDIGGYFSEITDLLYEKYEERLLGIIEDTENGHQKYMRKNLKFPVVSVARSPLKNNEDHLVGQGVVFSTELLLREQGVILSNKKVGVIGYGKIGNGVLSSLREKGYRVSVYDRDPITIISALSKGYRIIDRNKIIEESDIIICATGNISLKKDDFKFLKNGSYISSVTSSDDELDLSWLAENYEKKKIDRYIDLYYKNGHYFYLLYGGNAINFIHGGGSDDYILLVQKEMTELVMYMHDNNLSYGVQGGFSEIMNEVADRWIKKFTNIRI